MNEQKIAVLTDSGTNTPLDFAAAHDVKIVPLVINFSDGTYHTDVDITTEDVVRRLPEEIPSTSLPSPSTLLDILERCRAEGYEKAVFVTISSGLSSTNETVHLVANQIENFPVAVIDTKSIGVAAGLVTMNAALMVEAGVPFEELEHRLTELSEETLVLFCVNELVYLRKGGRISETVYRLGSALNIKPVFDCDGDGRYRIVKKSRGLAKAISAIEDLIVTRSRAYDAVTLAICSADPHAPVDTWERNLRQRVPNEIGLLRSGITADLIVHTGPTLVGMAVQPATEEMTRWFGQRSGSQAASREGGGRFTKRPSGSS